jgi:hypothetical protein
MASRVKNQIMEDIGGTLLLIGIVTYFIWIFVLTIWVSLSPTLSYGNPVVRDYNSVLQNAVSGVGLA